MWLLWSIACSFCLPANIGGSMLWSLEVAGKEWIEGGAEEDLSTTKLWEGEPEDKGELEEIVKWEPVGWFEATLNDAQEGEADPVCQPLRIIGLSNCEESLKRVEGGDDKTSKVDQKLASQVEED